MRKSYILVGFKNVLVVLLVMLLASCSSLQEKIVKDENGKMKEKYTIDKKTGFKEGKYLAYFDNQGISEEGIYVDNKLQGERKIYKFESDVVEIIEHYNAGKLNGEYTVYYTPDKLKLKGYYKDDKTVGEWISYYENGQIKEKVTMADNNENGPFVEYYENGNLKAEGIYLDGDNEDGLLKLYNEEGVLIKKMDCVKRRCKTIWEIDKE